MNNVTPIITIGLIADLHYANITVGTRCCSESLSKLQAAIEVLKEHSPDLTVCLGDVIDKSETIEEELVCITQVVECLDEIHTEKHFVLGNHDVSELSKQQFLKACGQKNSYYSFDKNGVHIIILDSNFNPDGGDFGPGNFIWNNAWIGEKQIEWLKKDLTTTDKPILVFCHANLDDRIRENGELNGHIVKDSAIVRKMLEESGNVKAVIQGHDHSGWNSTINGIPYIALRAMVEGSGLEENSFAKFTLYVNGSFSLQGFEKQASIK